MFCNSLTKNNQPCKLKVTENTPLYNGMRLCHIHCKNLNNIVAVNNNVNNVINNYDNAENVLKNKVRCISKTKKGCRCSKKTGDDSKMCHVHKKNIEKRDISEDKIEEVSESILSIIKSPCINYKIDKKSDNCYICLEETESRLSCGHFIHKECILNMLQSNIKKNYKVFEHKNNYFIITNCLYCNQISIMKNVPITDKLKNKYKSKIRYFEDKMKINNSTISHYFGELFIRYDIYETKEQLDNIKDEFMKELKQLIFDNFATIVFDNYIQQKNINKIPLRYEKIDKKIILQNLNNTINETLYSKYLFNILKNKMELFFRILENVISKMLDMDNAQDDLLSLVNVF